MGTPAFAAPPSPTQLRISGTQSGLATTDFAPVRGLEFRAERDLMWTRLSLADDLPIAPSSDGTMTALRPPSLLQGLDLRDDIWTATPGAVSGVATAATSLVTSGVSVFEVVRGGKVRARHMVRCFFRSRGLKLAWRIEF